MNFPDAVRSALNNYATFSGRARRSEFWFFFLFTILVQAAGSILDGTVFDLPGGGPVGGLASLALLVPSIAVTARRLHDTGRSGWWMLICVVPLVGWIFLLIWYCNRGEDGPNRFGADPRAAVAGGRMRPWPVNPPAR
jgi:uncharacterized membrane protein YhaH (DUF805 family)